MKSSLEERLQLAVYACKVAHLLGPQAAILDAIAILDDIPDFAITEGEVTRIFQRCETANGDVTIWSRQAIMARDALRYCLRARAALKAYKEAPHEPE